MGRVTKDPTAGIRKAPIPEVKLPKPEPANPKRIGKTPKNL